MAATKFLTAAQLRGLLDDREAVRLWLSGLGLRDPERGYRDLRDLASRGLSSGCLTQLVGQLDQLLPRCPDAGMALTNLERFVTASIELGDSTELLSHPRTLEIALQLFSTSQFFSELLIREPSLLDWLRSGTERPSRPALIEGLRQELDSARTDEERKLRLRRFRRREILRIGYNDIVRELPLELTTLDLSQLADACLEVALEVALKHADEKFGPPVGRGGHRAKFVVLGLGKLGGLELNYSSDIDLIFLYDVEGQTAGPKVVSNSEYFGRMGSEIVRLLSDQTALGVAYRVDMRLRPEGHQGPLARSLRATLGYYDTSGRTWERQALIKCRPVAGDLDLGQEFLDALTPFVYRNYLSAAEIGEIKAMKRRIEGRTVSSGNADHEVKTGHGGIRDVEFVVQFLQLLHGGRYAEVRHANTLAAMARLELVGCLTAEERGIMEDTYRFLRKVEHRLQTMFDRQTHEMPRDLESQRVLAIRLGYPPASIWEDRTGPAQRFQADYRAKTDLNRRILNHLLHDAFADDRRGADEHVFDLILDPNPTPELIAAALGPYPFRDRQTAYENLMALAREESPFLSQPRCLHFLASIAPRLLEAVCKTLDPDMALNNLEKVSASLGAKAVLWELFNFNPPTLRLYVELCSTSQFLCEILINNPGMVDDLMDSLVDDRALPASAIRAELADLCRGAEDLTPILLGFRNKELVRIGTRDILGREPIRDVTRELADVAEAIVGQVAREQFQARVEKVGHPRRAADGKRSRWAIVAMGKLGGRELNYHSDLDLVFLHDGDTPESEEFFTDLVKRVLRALGGSSGTSRLYAVDTRLRPHGSAGALAITLEGLRQYFGGNGTQHARSWERLALTRARVIYSSGGLGRDIAEAIRDLLIHVEDVEGLSRDALEMRKKLEGSSGTQDLRRGLGGLLDIEFLVQYLQIVELSGGHADSFPRSNVWDALDALRRCQRLDPVAHAELRDAYEFLRTVENRLRIVQNRPVVELPDSLEELVRLTRRLGFDQDSPEDAVAAFRSDFERHCTRTRAHFVEAFRLER